MKKPNVRHSSAEDRWGSPREAVDIAKVVLDPHGDEGGILVDPFSEAEFNKLVGAHRFFTGEKGSDGYKERWVDHVDAPRADWILSEMPTGVVVRAGTPDLGATAFVNAPGDITGENIKRAWKLLDRYHTLGWIDSAVWVGFNLNQWQTLQSASDRHPLHSSFLGCRCVPDHRLGFIKHSESKSDGAGDQPSHPCFFMLLPSHEPLHAAMQVSKFRSAAGALGAVF